jgi:hypothetical protein
MNTNSSEQKRKAVFGQEMGTFYYRFLPNTAPRFVPRPSHNCLDYRVFQNGSALLLPQRIKIVVMHNMQMWTNIHVQRCRTWFLSHPVTTWRKQYRTAEIVCSKVILITWVCYRGYSLAWWSVSVFAIRYIMGTSARSTVKHCKLPVFKWHWNSNKQPVYR